MFIFYLNNYLSVGGALLIMGAKCSWCGFGHSGKLPFDLSIYTREKYPASEKSTAQNLAHLD